MQIELDGSNGQTYEQAFKHAMARLNTSRVPYGALYEKTMGWSNTWVWQSGDTTDFSQLKQTWRDIQAMQINTVADRYTPMLANVNKAVSNRQIPLLCIHAGFGYIDTAALRLGRMRVENNQLVDAGTESPYASHRVCMAGLGVAEVSPGVTYTLVAHPDYLFNSIASPMERVIRYFVKHPISGAYISLPINGSASISFPWGAHVQYIEFMVRTSRRMYKNVQRINVVYDDATAPRSADANEPEHQLLTSDIAFQGYDESAPSISHADYHIYYHYKSPTNLEAEKVLKKPIVILDGFDPQDERNYKELYNEKLKYGNGIKLGEELRKKGYDVVILNFPMTGSTEDEYEKNGKVRIPLINDMRRDGGTDYIERNAFLLVKLIQTLNAKLAQNGSAEKLVIVGPSMGGQISRYALAYMEKQGMDHRTRIWLSFDSPHLGANIPLAIQQTLYFFGFQCGQEDAKKGYNEKLHTPAARQMLIEQLDGLNGTAYFHWRYYNALNNNGLPGSGGWPQKIDKKLAPVNGAGNGASNGYLGEEFLHLYAYWSTFLGDISIANISNKYMPDTGQTAEYFRGRLLHYKIFKLWKIPIGIAIYLNSGSNAVTNNNPHGSTDLVPGGTYDVEQEIRTQFSKALYEKLNTIKQLWRWQHNQCFIPTISALALKDNSFQWNTPLTEELIKQKGIPFDSYYIPSENQDHVSLNQESVMWLMNQLEGVYYNVRKKPEMENVTQGCSSTSYTLKNVPSNVTCTWTCSSNLALVSNTGLNATFNRVDTANGATWVQAVAALNGQIIATVKKDGWIGTPDTYIDESSTAHIPNSSSIGIMKIKTEGITQNNYVFFNVMGGPYDSLYVENHSPDKIDIYSMNEVFFVYPKIKQGSKGGGYFIVGAVNACGKGNPAKIIVNISDRNPDPYPYRVSYILYPNPTNSTATLKIAKNDNNAAARSSANQAQQETIQTLTLTDMMGNVVRRNKYAAGTKSVEINVAGLPKGIYIVAVNEQNQNQQTLKLAVE